MRSKRAIVPALMFRNTSVFGLMAPLKARNVPDPALKASFQTPKQFSDAQKHC